jgi:phage baseplate assembly protein W
MAINQDINIYGKEAPKQALFNSKSKGARTYGLRFPFGNLEDGLFLKKSSDIELIKSNLRQLLLTTRGERVMLPSFGTNLRNYLMEPLDQALLSQIRREISESIYKYAPNVDLKLLQVFPLDQPTLNGGHSLLIKLVCSLKENDGVGFEVKVEIR